MNIDKQHLKNKIISQLEVALQNAMASADSARKEATDDQSVAETQYDTLGLEASYLAHGQSERAAQLIEQIQAYKALEFRQFGEDDAIAISAVILLQSLDAMATQHYFIGPFAGGMQINVSDITITVITPNAPLARELIGLYQDDEFIWPSDSGHKRVISGLI
ncbi:transcription elongation factor GreAB [Thalassotalea sp. Y01]|uniref:transcription elongation factor GreAB n=1 Tax=Thalassotalea sp. Y01 TaxID=2729613 RepID=UPI00145C5A06|nr:transcription elongation factor GreAB [Thalassotalea sp. Y01]NMP15666.1 transcription elongation factor GreAB [Thalassotalea sp. Y01]